MKNIHRIVITGGPCAGKTTAFARIESELSALGYKVFVVPETFSEMYSGGIKLWEYENITFQDMLFRMQLYKEEIYNEAAKKCHEKNVVILYDRGAIDGLAYTDVDDVAKIFDRNNLTLNVLMNRYDAVIHMITAADGAKDVYLANMKSNVARYEDVESAITTDHALKNVWTGHPHLRIVDNSTDFSAKITRVMNEICSIIGKPAPLEIEKKFLIKKPSLKHLKKFTSFSMTQIVQTYLCDDSSGIERRVRMRGLPGDYTFFYTEKKPVSPGVRIETERKISEKEYLDFVFQSDYKKRQIQKTRFCFVYKNLYYELDFYPFWKDTAILEIELTSKASQFILPEFITVIKDVTDDPQYFNYNLASKIPNENE